MPKTITALVILVVLFSLMTGCATTSSSGVNRTVSHVQSIERIVRNRHVGGLDGYEGVALLSLGKAGALGLGVMGWSVSAYVRDPETGQFGPPAFARAAGPSIGLGYLGLNKVDCLILFKERQQAINFALRTASFNFSNEASFFPWGRKQMTLVKDKRVTDGSGLAIGVIELEFLFGGPNNKLHRNLYGSGATVTGILNGETGTPPEMKAALDNLNALMPK